MGAFGLFTKLEVGMKLHEAEVEAARQKKNAYDDGLAQGRLEGKAEQEAKDRDKISGYKAAVTRYANLAKKVKKMEKIVADHHFIFSDDEEPHTPAMCKSTFQPVVSEDEMVVVHIAKPYLQDAPFVELSHETAAANNLTS
jgi:hypothetical protein